MPTPELPESQYAKLKKQLQDSILREYPNPERKGCQGDIALKTLASRPDDDRIERDANWHHLTHCAECYREFLAFRAEIRYQARKRRVLLSWAFVAVTAAVAVCGFFVVRRANSTRPRNAELAYTKKIVNIDSMTRSEDPIREPKPIVLEREPEELTIQLPVGSKAGRYEFQLRKSNQPVISTNAVAAIRDGTTSFLVRIDLSKFDPGKYSMNVRRIPWDWSYYPVVIR